MKPSSHFLKYHKTNRIPVFVVEDNPLYSFMLTYNLEKDYNFNITNFDSGEGCLLNLKKYNPAIVILDFKLKNINGLNVLKYIKHYYPGIYVFIITEQKDLQTTIELAENGADDYIQKNSVTLQRLKYSLLNVCNTLWN